MKKISMTAWMALASLAVAVLLAVQVVAVHVQIRRLATEWQVFTEAAVVEQGRLRTARLAAGYGGFIHHFKNYVLGRERTDYLEAGRKLDEMQQALRDLEPAFTDDASRQHLKQITRVFAEYRDQWVDAGSAGAQALTAAALNDRVRVSDSDAIEGFAALSAQIDLRRRQGYEHFQASLQTIALVGVLGLLFVPAVLLLGGWLWSAYRAMQRNERALEQARADAVAANLGKSRIVANMSHEIRTPMNAVIGLSGLALQQDVPPRLRSYLDKIHSAGQSLLVVINDILDFSKAEAGHITLQQVDFDIERLFSETLRTVALAAHQKQLELVLNIEPLLPRHLVGDPDRLGQVLLKLVSNALKFTDNGEVRVALTTVPRQAHAHAHAQGHGHGHAHAHAHGHVHAQAQAQALPQAQTLTLRCAVTDTGAGLTEAQRGALFQPFSQADTSATRRHGGTGLGLSICRQLVQLMGGTLGVDSQPGRGSTFWFELTLPLAARPQTAPTPPAVRALAGLRALVIDDTESSRIALRDYLAALQIQVDLASGGEEALQRFGTRIAEGGFDLLLVDWRMPGMDGLETARRVRAMDGLPLLAPQRSPRLIMVSAHDVDDIRRQARQAGMQGFLPKPVSPTQLLQVVLDCLDRDAGPGAAIEPLAAPGPPAPHAGSKAPAVTPSSLQRLAGQRLLLAEDNEVNQFVALACLEPIGLHIDVAGNGLLAWQMFNAALPQAPYALVLMDVQMPELDGLEATRRIRASAGGATVPIIAMTAGATAEERAACFDAGMSGFVGKPVTQEDLLRALAAALADPPLPAPTGRVATADAGAMPAAAS